MQMVGASMRPHTQPAGHDEAGRTRSFPSRCFSQATGSSINFESRAALRQDHAYRDGTAETETGNKRL